MFTSARLILAISLIIAVTGGVLDAFSIVQQLLRLALDHQLRPDRAGIRASAQILLITGH
jgi:hypothetical protein